ncbi:hypothetical protein V8G54_030422, partial [Vigna mungo]
MESHHTRKTTTLFLSIIIDRTLARLSTPLIIIHTRNNIHHYLNSSPATKSYTHYISAKPVTIPNQLYFQILSQFFHVPYSLKVPTHLNKHHTCPMPSSFTRHLSSPTPFIPIKTRVIPPP